MEMTLNNGFVEMNDLDMVLVDGGVDGWGVASGLLSVAGGVCAFAASTGTDIVTCGVTIPATTASKAAAVCWIASGVTGIVAACN